MGDVVGGLHGAAIVGGLERPGALDDGHRLQLLLAHDGAHAVLRRHVTVVAVDRREAHEVLAGRADRVHGELVSGQPRLPVEGVLGLPGVEAEQRLGVAELDHVIVDVEVDPLLRLPLNDDGVVAGVLEVGAEEAVGLRRRGAVGHGADRHDGERARAPHRQAGERAGGQHQPIVRVVPRHVALAAARGRLAIEDDGAEPGAAHVFPHVGRRPRLGPALLLRKVHAQELARVRARLWRRGRCRRFLRQHWTHTATGVSPGAFAGRPRTVSESSRPAVFTAM